ncbi:MAG: membrane dipeptidase [Clostridia bacterium]|nr:membrane dipeptidase [Clostridia bacterium]
MKLFDLHCDTLYECAVKNIDMKINDLQISLERGAKYSPWFQCFAVWMPDELRGHAAEEHFDRCYEYLQRQIDKHSDFIVQYTGGDFDGADKRCRAVLTVEGGSAFAGKPERILYLKKCGVAAVTLTWNGANEICDGVMTENAGGLTDFGFDCVREMESCGIVVDVSHISQKGFWDVDSVAQKPYIATHSNSGFIRSHVRNLTDEQFTAIKNRGGLVGINLYTKFVADGDDYTLEQLKRHIDHFLSLGGERVLAIGTDFDGAQMPSCLGDISRLDSLYDYLLQGGCSEQLCDDIFFNNAYSFMRKYAF